MICSTSAIAVCCSIASPSSRERRVSYVSSLQGGEVVRKVDTLPRFDAVRCFRFAAPRASAFARLPLALEPFFISIPYLRCGIVAGRAVNQGRGPFLDLCSKA